jgi:hypothetical protein
MDVWAERLAASRREHRRLALDCQRRIRTGGLSAEDRRDLLMALRLGMARVVSGALDRAGVPR